MTNTLGTHVVAVERELAPMVSAGFLTVATAKALGVGVGNYQALRAVGLPVGGRHFAAIDALTTARLPTPVSRARECLSDLGREWDGVRDDFHKLRALYLEARLGRAKLAKAQQALGAITDLIERDIAEAELALDAARIEAKESEVARGEAGMKSALAKVAEHSDRYALVLKESGKESFTEDDFKAEEADHILLALWWSTAQSFETFDQRDRWDRSKTKASDDSRAEVWRERRAAEENMDVRVQLEVFTTFETMGITKAVLGTELMDLARQRNAFDQFDSYGRGSFLPYTEAWVKRMVEKYRPNILGMIQRDGIDRLRRVLKLIAPTDDDEGDGGDPGNQMRRGSMFR